MREQFVDSGCENLGDCLSAKDFQDDYKTRVDELAEESGCSEAAKAFYAGMYINFFGGMGCTYDLNAIGLEEYGIDACKLGKVERFNFHHWIVCGYFQARIGLNLLAAFTFNFQSSDCMWY